jgi:hypothetical protein
VSINKLKSDIVFLKKYIILELVTNPGVVVLTKKRCLPNSKWMRCIFLPFSITESITWSRLVLVSGSGSCLPGSGLHGNFFCQNVVTFSIHSPSHHVKYIKRHMYGAVNVGKKVTNHTVILYITSRIF